MTMSRWSVLKVANVVKKINVGSLVVTHKDVVNIFMMSSYHLGKNEVDWST